MASEVRFSVAKRMLESKGYALDRIKGSHHIFVKAQCRPFVLPVHKNKVKPVYIRKIKELPD